MKKLLAMILCLGMLLSSAAFAEVLGTYPVTDEEITFTVWGVMQANTYHDTLEDNIAWQELEKITGVNLEWECVTDEGNEEKRALRLAQGDYPDLFIRSGMTNEELASLATAGMLVDLAPMIEEYAPNFNALMERDETIRVAVTDDDGAIYALPQVTTYVQTNHMIINTRWLENLGLDMPTTVDEYYDCLVAFKEQDANGNGDPNDEIPLTGSLSLIMEWFGVYPTTDNGMFVYPGTSEVQSSWIADGMKDAMTFLNKLYEEGLIDPEVFVQDGDTLNAKGHADTLGSFAVAGAFVNVGNDLHWDYAGLPVFPDQNGNAYTNKRASCGGNQFIITTNCEHPEIALQMIDYLYSDEGTTLAWMGVEGTTWEWTDDTQTMWDWILPEGKTVTQMRSSETMQGGVGYPSAHPVWFESDMWAKQANEIEASLDTDLFRMPRTNCGVLLWPNVTFTVEQSEEMAFFMPDCKSYYEAALADFVTGVRDIETEWDSYVETMKSMNIEEGIQMYQEAYDNYMAKMNG